MENLKQWMVYTSCVTSWGSCLENVFFFPRVTSRGLVKGTQCATHNCRECDVRFLSYLYVYTCFAHKYFMEVGYDLCVCSICVCLGFRKRKTELTRQKSERHHLPGEGYISGMDVKVSKSIQERLIMVSLKWPISFHRQGDARLSCVRLGHCT